MKSPTIKILDDKTNGIVKLSLVKRVNEGRKYKFANNYTGILQKAETSNLRELCQILNKNLPPKEGQEVVVGMIESGVVMACMLASVRDSRFTYSTKREYLTADKPIKITEKRVQNRVHHFYGLHQDDKVILIEDEVSTGKGLIQAFRAITKNNVEVRALCSIVEVINYEAGEKVKRETGLNLISLVKVKVD